MLKGASKRRLERSADERLRIWRELASSLYAYVAQEAGEKKPLPEGFLDVYGPFLKVHTAFQSDRRLTRLYLPNGRNCRLQEKDFTVDSLWAAVCTNFALWRRGVDAMREKDPFQGLVKKLKKRGMSSVSLSRTKSAAMLSVALDTRELSLPLDKLLDVVIRRMRPLPLQEEGLLF